MPGPTADGAPTAGWVISAGPGRVPAAGWAAADCAVIPGWGPGEPAGPGRLPSETAGPWDPAAGAAVPPSGLDELVAEVGWPIAGWAARWYSAITGPV